MANGTNYTSKYETLIAKTTGFSPPQSIFVLCDSLPIAWIIFYYASEI